MWPATFPCVFQTHLPLVLRHKQGVFLSAEPKPACKGGSVRIHFDPLSDPNRLLDALLQLLDLKCDAALCRTLNIAGPLLSKVRHHGSPVSAALLLRIHEVTGISIFDLRALMKVKSDDTPKAAASESGAVNSSVAKKMFGDANNLLDELQKLFSVKNDRELAKLIRIHPATISRMRSGKVPVSPDALIKMHEASGLGIAHLKALL